LDTSYPALRRSAAVGSVAVRVLLATVVLALVVLGPTWAAPSELAVGSEHVDLVAHFWSLWWARADPALANFGGPIVDLYVLEPINLLLMGWLEPIDGPVLAHNLTALVALVVAGLGGWVLGHRVGGDRMSGWVGLVLVMLSPPMLDALVDGTGEFTWLGLPALALATFLPLRERWSPSAAALAAIATWLTAWSCWYHGFFLGLVVVGMALPLGRRAWLRCAAPLVVAALALVPLVLAFGGSDLELPRLAGVIDEPVTRLRLLEPLPLIASKQPRRDGWELAVLLLAVAGTWRLRRAAAPWLLVVAIGWCLSLGSELGGVPLPFRTLNELLLLVGRPLHLPFHFQVVTLLGLVPLAAVGAASPRPRWLVPVVALALVGGLAVPRSGWMPLPTTRLPTPVPLVALAEIEGGAVLDLPSVLRDDQEALDHEALGQLVHRHPIPRFPVFPTSRVADQGIQAVRATRLVRSLAEEQGFADIEDLRALGYGWIVLDLSQAAEWESALEVALGPPRWRGEDLAVFEI